MNSIQFHDKQLHIYITIPNTLKKDGVLSPALVSEKELQHYEGRAGSKKKEAILKYLDSTFPGRSRSISVLTEPIPDTAAPKFLEFRNETQHVILPPIEQLKKLKLIDEVRLSKRPYPVVTQLDYKKIDWSKNPTNLLFKDINHYQLVLTTGKIPSNVIEIDEIKHSQESKGITMSDDSHIDLNNETDRKTVLEKIATLIKQIPNRGISTKPMLAAEILNRYIERTEEHIKLVRNCGLKLIPFIEEKGISGALFEQELANHDHDKLDNSDIVPIYAAYTQFVYNNGKYKDLCRLEDGVKKEFNEVAWPLHYKLNSHHVGEHFGKLVDDCYVVESDNHFIEIAHMVADWMAVGIEMGNSASSWWDKCKSENKYKFQKNDTEFLEYLLSKGETNGTPDDSVTVEELSDSNEDFMFGWFDNVSTYQNKYYRISGFPVKLFLQRAKKKFKSTRLSNLFTCNRGSWSSNRTITIHKFFIPELLYLMKLLKLSDTLYNAIYSKTWISKDLTNNTVIDVSRITKNMNCTLYKHQTEFIETYPKNKDERHLKGYLLSFEQGLGKTITALALMEALAKDVIIVICPKNTVYETWSTHIKTFYKKEQTIYHARSNDTMKNKRFYIFNYDAMTELIGLLKTLDTKNIGIIVDESHNFLRLASQRTKLLMDISHNNNSSDILLLSGTPVKCAGAEMMPLLQVLDPYFDNDAQVIFKNTFGFNQTVATSVLNARLTRVMTRVTKENFGLPEKTERIVNVSMPTGSKYTISSVKKEMLRFAEERWAYHEKLKKQYNEEFDSCLNYLKQSKEIVGTSEGKQNFDRYVKVVTFLRENPNVFIAGDQDIIWANQYEREVLEKALPQDRLKLFRHSKAAVKYLRLKINGEVLGSCLSRLRIQMTSDMLQHSNLLDIVEEAEKKTVIFTSYVDTIELCEKYFKYHKYDTITVYGKTASELTSNIALFQKDPNKNPLIASLKMLSTGATLTAANTVVFLNKPWRSIDFKQASDRVHRIGQDTDVDIITLLLDTGSEGNLSTRMEDIMSWSEKLFGDIVDGTQTNMSSETLFNNIHEYMEEDEFMIDTNIEATQINQLSKENYKQDTDSIINKITELAKTQYKESGPNQWPHINRVLREGYIFCKMLKIEMPITLYTAILFHDCAKGDNTKEHDKESAKKAKPILEPYFNKHDLSEILTAIAEHNNNRPGTSQISELLKASDANPLDIPRFLIKLYWKRKDKNMSESIIYKDCLEIAKLGILTFDKEGLYMPKYWKMRYEKDLPKVRQAIASLTENDVKNIIKVQLAKTNNTPSYEATREASNTDIEGINNIQHTESDMVSDEGLLTDMKKMLAGSAYARLFHISPSSASSMIMTPRQQQEPGPDRICFSKSLKGCFAACPNRDSVLSVYVIDPDSVDPATLKKNTVVPTNDQVYDASITQEVWVKCKVRVLQLMTVKFHYKKTAYAEDQSAVGDTPVYKYRNDYASRKVVVHVPKGTIEILRLNESTAKKVYGLAGYTVLKNILTEHKKKYSSKELLDIRDICTEIGLDFDTNVISTESFSDKVINLIFAIFQEGIHAFSKLEKTAREYEHILVNSKEKGKNEEEVSTNMFGWLSYSWMEKFTKVNRNIPNITLDTDTFNEKLRNLRNDIFNEVDINKTKSLKALGFTKINKVTSEMAAWNSVYITVKDIEYWFNRVKADIKTYTEEEQHNAYENIKTIVKELNELKRILVLIARELDRYYKAFLKGKIISIEELINYTDEYNSNVSMEKSNIDTVKSQLDKPILEVLSKLQPYTYGYLYKDGKFITDQEEIKKRDGSGIIVQSPESTDKNKGGMCHDAMIYIHLWLKKHNVEHKCVYIETDKKPELPTHSFVVAKIKNNKWVILDNFAIDGGHSDTLYTTANDAMIVRCQNWIIESKFQKYNNHAFILSTIPTPGVTIEPFMMVCKDNNPEVDYINKTVKSVEENEQTIDHNTETSLESLEYSTEAIANINAKKKAILDYICKACDLMDPSKTNSNMYRQRIEKMNEKDFDKFMHLIKEGKFKLHLVIPNMKLVLKSENLLKAAKQLNVKLFHKIWMTDHATGRKYLTDNEYLVLKLPVRRQQQFLDEKMSVPDNDKTIDGLTGQVTGDSKASSITNPEIQILAARGLENTLREFVTVRGGNIHQYADFKRQLEEQGECNLELLDPNSKSRSAVIGGVLLKCMMIDNNI